MVGRRLRGRRLRGRESLVRDPRRQASRSPDGACPRTSAWDALGMVHAAKLGIRRSDHLRSCSRPGHQCVADRRRQADERMVSDDHQAGPARRGRLGAGTSQVEDPAPRAPRRSPRRVLRALVEAFQPQHSKADSKSREAGIVVERDDTGCLLQDLYDVYLRWAVQGAAARGIPSSAAVAQAKRSEPFMQYETVARHLGAGCRIWIARIDGQAIASIITLLHGAHAHCWRSASDKKRAGRANDLLQDRAIEDAADSGCRYFHMGESGGVESLMAFKEKFGAERRVYDELRFEPFLIGKIGNFRDHLAFVRSAAAGVRTFRRGVLGHEHKGFRT
jgi:hypothetical protein